LTKEAENKRKEHLKNMTIMGEKNNQLYNTLLKERKEFIEEKSNLEEIIEEMRSKI
jgi:hypothetical protein